MKRVFRALLDRSVPLEVGRMRHRLLARLGNYPILVYTMGKVGSRTVVESLKQAQVSSLVYHVHFLSPKNLNRIQAKYENAGDSTPSEIKFSDLLSGDLNHLLSGSILSPMNLQGTIVISLIRDPVDTFFSHVFQNPKTHRPFLLGDDGKISKNAVEQHVREHFSSFGDDGDYISNWFDDEFSGYCGVDVYAHPFDRDLGFGIIREGPWNIAVLALENLSVGLPRAINELTGKQFDIEIVKRNVRTNTIDKELYRAIKDNVSIPADCLQKVYATRYARHFFSQEHMQAAIEKWSKKR